MVKTRSSAKQRVMDAAFEHFVLYGYEGASLNGIAETVGIRKASLYTHFSSKDALFLELLDDALRIEQDYVSACFDKDSSRQSAGEDYLLQCETRYHQAVTARFLTRTAYVPPVLLVTQVMQQYNLYIEHVRQQYQRIMTHYCKHPQQLETFTDAYMGILDSLNVELMYAGPLYQRRLNAMLMLYRNSLKLIE